MNPKLLPKSGGIYCIKNGVNGKIYVGRTSCFYKRCYQYIYDFNNRPTGRINDYLLNSMIKYGIENFTFEVIENCSFEIQPERELYWILKLNTTNREIGYNLRLDVDGNMVTAPETSKKISDNLKTQWSSGVRSGHSQKLKESWKGRDRLQQGELLSKILTKYVYVLYYQTDEEIEVSYKELKALGLASVLSSFSRRGKDTATCKGVKIHRRKLEN